MRVCRAIFGLKGEAPFAQAVRSLGGVTPGIVTAPHGNTKCVRDAVALPMSQWSMRLASLAPLRNAQLQLPGGAGGANVQRVSWQACATSNQTITLRAVESAVTPPPLLVIFKPETTTCVVLLKCTTPEVTIALARL